MFSVGARSLNRSDTRGGIHLISDSFRVSISSNFQKQIFLSSSTPCNTNISSIYPMLQAISISLTMWRAWTHNKLETDTYMLQLSQALTILDSATKAAGQVFCGLNFIQGRRTYSVRNVVSWARLVCYNHLSVLYPKMHQQYSHFILRDCRLSTLK